VSLPTLPIKLLSLSASLLLAAHSGFAQRVAVVRLPALQQRLAQSTDTTYVVNFWATWCGPCVRELPAFEKVRAATVGQKIKFLYVSVDNVGLLAKKVRPFVRQHRLQAEVVLLDEPDPTTSLTKLDHNWSGVIPFTLIINNQVKQRQTFATALTAAELATALQKFPH
jgi:thiol-disulfide isomerase/thioredoxin